MSPIDLPWLLEHATYGLLLALLLAAGLGMPVSEDVILLVAGALLHRGTTALTPTAAVVLVGVMGGDLMIFLTAKHLGTRALERPLFRRLLPDKRRARLERLFQRWGGGIVFAARHVAGIRAPVFALAGINRLPTTVFVVFDLAGLTISAPVMVGLGYLFADQLERALGHVTRVQHVIVFAVVLLVAGYASYVVLRRWVGRRRA
jgi:membrane protein DedA with SNARE-associated domain